MSCLEFLSGCWEGTGLHHDVEIHGRLVIRSFGEGGFVEQRDQLIEDGRVVHEDLAIYRWDPASQSLRVQHYAPPGRMIDHFVLLDDERGGIRWIAGPGAARIEIWPDGERLHVTVLLPGESEPSMHMCYRRTSRE